LPGVRRDASLVTARDLKADGAMAVLLREALQPNLVQTLEGSPTSRTAAIRCRQPGSPSSWPPW
jgi:formyltetrahydrofolate synthetase